MISLRASTSLRILLLTGFLLSGCSAADKDDPAGPAVFEAVVADQEAFRFALHDPALIAAAEAWQEDGTEIIVQGTVARGDGGFNAPYSWHLLPASVTFPNLTMEVCSGRPQSDVEEDVDYWIELGTYCPWGVRITQRIE